MADVPKDPQSVLVEAIKKRDELNIFIRMHAELWGLSVPEATDQAVAGAAPASTGNGQPAGPVQGDPLDAIYAGQFFGKSQPQAAKMFLEMCRPRPQTTKALLAALEKGGAKVGGKKPAVNLWGVLNRSGDFVMVPRAGWGLAEWYDPTVLARLRKEAKEGQDKDEAAGE